MTDKDTITLLREVAEHLTKMLEECPLIPNADWSERDCDALNALRAALSAPKQEHPGYIIGSHWLETAYSRICAGEAEADVLRDCGWERVDDAEALRRENERLREALESIAKTDLRGVSLLAAGSVLLKVVDKAKAALRREET